MTFRSKLVRTCIALGTTFLFGTAVLNCGGDDDDSSAGAGGGDTVAVGNGGTGGSISTVGNGGATSAGTNTGTAGRFGRFPDAGDTCGCLDSAGECHIGMSSRNCGTGGGQCVACADGQMCSNGACVADTGTTAGGGRFNTDANYENGCVDAEGGPHRGTSDRNCGSNGGLCVACAEGTSCSREERVCVAETTEDDAG
jgi:hypothetical protein